MIDSIREELPDLQKARDASELSEQSGLCSDIETWLRASLAAYAQVSGIGGAWLPYEKSPSFAAFLRVTEQALKAMEKGESPEGFFNSIPGGEQSLTMSAILAVAGGFCRDRGADWSGVAAAIRTGKTEGLPGELRTLAAVLADRLPVMTDAAAAAGKSSPSEQSGAAWCAAIFAAYCRSPEALLAFISDRLGRYLERWRIPHSLDRFPYAMNTKRYTWYREHAQETEVFPSDRSVKGGGKKAWEEHWKKKLIAFDGEFFTHINADRYVMYEGKCCPVDPAGYTKKGDGSYVKSADGSLVRLSGRELYLDSARIDRWYLLDGDEFRETFDLQIYDWRNDDCNSRCGKGSPELMQYVVQRLREQGMPTDKATLARFALGIDCSGFVTRAIVSLMIELKIPLAKQLETIGPAYGRLKTNATTLRGKGRRVIFTYRYKNSSSKSFVCSRTNNTPPKKDYDQFLQPGDVVMLKRLEKGKGTILNDGFHIWIVKDVSSDSFTLMESRARNKTGPTAQSYASLEDFVKPIELAEGVSILKEKKKDAAGKVIETERKVNWESVLEFARPLIFADPAALSDSYIRFLTEKA